MLRDSNAGFLSQRTSGKYAVLFNILLLACFALLCSAQHDHSHTSHQSASSHSHTLSNGNSFEHSHEGSEQEHVHDSQPNDHNHGPDHSQDHNHDNIPPQNQKPRGAPTPVPKSRNPLPPPDVFALIKTELYPNGSVYYFVSYESGHYLLAKLVPEKGMNSFCHVTDQGENRYVIRCEDEVDSNRSPVLLIVTRPFVLDPLFEFEQISKSCRVCNSNKTCIDSIPTGNIRNSDPTVIFSTRVIEYPGAIPTVPRSDRLPVCTGRHLSHCTGKWVISKESGNSKIRIGSPEDIWIKDKFLWSVTECNLQYRTPSEVREHFNSKNITSILFFGDSLTRNMYYEFISFFQGTDPNPHKDKPFPMHYLNTYNIGTKEKPITVTYICAFTLFALEDSPFPLRGLDVDGEECWNTDRDAWSIAAKTCIGEASLRTYFKENGSPSIIVAGLGIHYLNPWLGFTGYATELHKLLDIVFKDQGFRGNMIFRSMSGMRDEDASFMRNNAKITHYDQLAHRIMADAKIPFMDVRQMSLRRQDRLFDAMHVFPLTANDKYTSWDAFPRLLSNDMLLILLAYMW